MASGANKFFCHVLQICIISTFFLLYCKLYYSYLHFHFPGSQNISKVFNSTAEELCCDANSSDSNFESKLYNKTIGKTDSKSCYVNDGYLYSFSDASASCIGYNNVTLDSVWKASRAFSILSVIFGSIGLLNLCVFCSLPNAPICSFLHVFCKH